MAKKKKRKSSKKGPLSQMGWPTIRFHPKTGKAVSPGTVMNPVTGAVYSDTSAGYKRAATDFNRFK